MRATQQIFRVRRQYNKWVANQTLEDYSLRFTATRARRWNIEQVAQTALGATAFLALEALAAAVTLQYGFINTLWAMLTVALVIILTGYPICYHAAKQGLDIDLLTRSAGFGYLGSTITSLIYASFTFIFFAIEAAILASALQALFHIPLAIGYVICALAVIPIVTHGISAISRFQLGSQPLWLVLQCSALIVVGVFEYREFNQWLAYAPPQVPEAQGFNLALFGAATAILFALVAQIGEQVDYLRFMPEQTPANKKRWWFWLMLAGPGWILIGLIKMLFGSFLAYLAFTRGASFEVATDPTYMYQMVFTYITQSPGAALILAGLLVIISQMKINVTNAYAGSLAWSNFFSRVTHNHPGRVVWLVFNVLIALILMELGIYRALEAILGVFAIVALSWLSCLSADLLINLPLKLRPPQTEFKRAQLYDINPVGVVSMLLASTVGIVCYLGYLGETAQHLAHFISIGLCFVSVPAIAWLTQGRYYLAREANLHLIECPPEGTPSRHTCCICENPFETPDICYCPAYQGAICSLCCSLDTRCLDSCKPEARAHQQFQHLMARILPQRCVDLCSSRMAKFLGVFIGVNLLSALLLSLVYYQVQSAGTGNPAALGGALWSLYFILMILFGIISWLFLLTHESREVAQQESNRQTQRLIDEIEAHKVTDQSLQQAKDLAERANQAKSRYLTGISHELRTPLQSISGYAQLLSGYQDTPDSHKKAVSIIRRNSEYLADLIEGLLDISKIEAGRLDIYRTQVKFIELLDQLEQMFGPVSREKGIEFRCLRQGQLPSHVMADEKRLRQILINLLSNAIKYTKEGFVELRVRYRNDIAEFTVQDSGVGIKPEDLQRILDPFERVRTAQVPNVSGTGLGLTIVKLLTEIMGGELKVESQPGKGSSFKVTLMLSRVLEPKLGADQPAVISGYPGPRKTLLVVDDEAMHRGLIFDLLQPLGFRVLEAPDAGAALDLIEQVQPHLFLLDISMPGKSGLELARLLRQRGYTQPIVMLSADAREGNLSMGQSKDDPENADYNAYLVKPINNQMLLDTLGAQLSIEWLHKTPPSRTESHTQTRRSSESPPCLPTQLSEKPRALLRQLLAQAEIGFYKGVRESLEQMKADPEFSRDRLENYRHLAERYQFSQLIQTIGEHYDLEPL